MLTQRLLTVLLHQYSHQGANIPRNSQRHARTRCYTPWFINHSAVSVLTLFLRVNFSALLGVFIVLLSLTSTSISVAAEAVNRQKITASYLYNFAKHVEWPNEVAMSSFDVAIYGDEDALLYAELMEMSAKVKWRNNPITVTQVNSVKALSQYDLIYVNDVNPTTIADIYNVIDSRPILLVTSDYSNKQWVMINLLTTTEGRMLFEVNNSTIINHGLKPLPELILTGGTEIDVAKLYREGQASLVALQKQLSVREAALNELATAIQKQEMLNLQLQQQLNELNNNIQKSDLLIATQNTQLQEQHEKIEAINKERLQLLNEVELRTQELNEQQRQLESIAIEITQREQRLAELNETIQRQEGELKKQKVAITSLDELVGSQQKALGYLWALVIVGGLLIGTIVIAYVIKRRDNERLAAHSQDLQIAKDRLAIAKRKAEDASQAKSEFLSLMSHELRTPLQAIIGYTDVVIEELKASEDPTHVSDLMRVINNSERLLKLINGVLDLAKIESGRMDLDLTEVKLSSLVQEAVDTVAPLIEKNKIRIKVEVDDGSLLPVADPEKLLHILLNLLGNAIKFSANGQVTIQAVHQHNRITICVADTGIGISSEQQQHIFDPFKQADSSTTRKFQGSGLGLSITRQLCELMGGSIRVESELGKGATFIVDIPLPIQYLQAADANAVVDADVDDNEIPVDPNGKQIVMIDDDPAFLDIMARTLRREGYRVHTAGDAETGWRLLQELKADVITLDLLLPDQHGWLLFEKIKNEEALKEIPVIIISIMDEGKYTHRRQAEEYLTKPIRRETLKLAVQKLVPMNK